MMAGVIMGLIMGGLGGPAIAWAVNQKGSLAAFEKRKAKFAAGEGKNPELDPFGPHKPFKQNAIMAGSIFGVIGLVIGFVVV